MENEGKKISERELAERRRRGKVAMHLQEIEDNPLTPEEVEMFEMFDRERWSDERCHEYIMNRVQKLAAPKG